MSNAPLKGAAVVEHSIETQQPKASTYTAVEVSAPGQLRIVQRQVAEPGPGQVRIRVEACGICHTDAYTVNGTYPGLTLPRSWARSDRSHRGVRAGGIRAESRSTSWGRFDRRCRRRLRTVQTRRQRELSEPGAIGTHSGWRICGSDDC